MSSFEPDNVDDTFASLTAELQFDWGVPTVPVIPNRWLPKDGIRVAIDQVIGEGLRDALLAEFSHIKSDLNILGTPDDPDQFNYDRLITDELERQMHTADTPMYPGEMLAVLGSGVVYLWENGRYMPHLITPERALFGRIIGPGHSKYAEADPEAINEYDPDSNEVLPCKEQRGVILLLSNAAICSARGYGAVRDESETAVVPIHNRKLALMKAIELSS